MGGEIIQRTISCLLITKQTPLRNADFNRVGLPHWYGTVTEVQNEIIVMIEKLATLHYDGSRPQA